MIIAHPDDEVIFGGTILTSTYVVCVTCGTEWQRRNEFQQSKLKNGFDGEIWPFLDDFNGFSEAVINILYKKIESLLVARRPPYVITHNENGEYGHHQHLQLYRIVKSLTSKIKTFQLADKLSDDIIAVKMKMLEVYSSQRHVFALPQIVDWIEHGVID